MTDSDIKRLLVLVNRSLMLRQTVDYAMQRLFNAKSESMDHVSLRNSLVADGGQTGSLVALGRLAVVVFVVLMPALFTSADLFAMILNPVFERFFA
ncbi:hypothetical protein EGH24_12990 [Halonotius terrestris]|jgi:hypothetical protein|uniref:Uncharacterized protein n=1 Tax=Halonotius terrestris TaxID=2487750 RepID=A0A8J8P9Z0_9EURY|nr:hypothetical protein [Halonotius terrestris]TQQ78753.1 hypothetical protein EGH24_12990 [Halonotius terrestris]